MALTDDEIVAIGSRFNGEQLIQQAKTLTTHARADSLSLPATVLPRVDATVVEVESLRKEQTTAKSVSKLGTVSQGVAFAALKDWVTDAVEACDNAFEDDPDTRDRFHKRGKKIGRSVPRLLERAVELSPLLAAADVAPAIAEWGFDAARLAEGETLINALREADAAQEAALKSLPPATYKLYLAQGKLYLDLKRIARRGRNTFKKNASRSGSYVLDILHRSSGGPKPAKKDSEADA